MAPVLVALHASPVQGATPANEKKADALYTEGSALFQRGRYEEALKRLEESQSLDPGTGTLIMVASCNEKLGQWRVAYAAFREARAQSVAQRKEDRVKYAQERLEALRERVVVLVVTRLSSAPGERVLIDDTPYVVAPGDEGMLLDLGDHKLVYEAPERLPQRLALSNLKGVQRVLLPSLQSIPIGAPALPAAAASTGGVPIWAWIAGGAGVASLGVAGVVQLGALSDYKEHKAACAVPDALRCSELYDSATRGETTAIVLASAGVVLVGVGVYGVVTAPPRATSSAKVRVSPWLGTTNGLQIYGNW